MSVGMWMRPDPTLDDQRRAALELVDRKTSRTGTRLLSRLLSMV